MSESTREDPGLKVLVELVLTEVRTLGATVARLEANSNLAVEAATRSRALDVYVETQIKPRLQKHGREIRELKRAFGESPMLAPVQRRAAIAPPAPDDDEDTGNFPIPPDAQAVLNEAKLLVSRERRRESFAFRQRRGIVGALLVAAIAAGGGYIFAHVTGAPSSETRK